MAANDILHQTPEEALAECRGFVYGIVDTLANLEKQLSDLEAKAKEGDATPEILSEIETLKAVIKRYDESLDIRCLELQSLKNQVAALCPPPDPAPPGHKEDVEQALKDLIDAVGSIHDERAAAEAFVKRVRTQELGGSVTLTQDQRLRAAIDALGGEAPDEATLAASEAFAVAVFSGLRVPPSDGLEGYVTVGRVVDEALELVDVVPHPGTVELARAAVDRGFLDFLARAGGVESLEPLTADERLDAAIALLGGGPPDETTVAASEQLMQVIFSGLRVLPTGDAEAVGDELRDMIGQMVDEMPELAGVVPDPGTIELARAAVDRGFLDFLARTDGAGSEPLAPLTAEERLEAGIAALSEDRLDPVTVGAVDDVMEALFTGNLVPLPTTADDAAAAADQVIRDALDVLSEQTLDPRTVEAMGAVKDVLFSDLVPPPPADVGTTEVGDEERLDEAIRALSGEGPDPVTVGALDDVFEELFTRDLVPLPTAADDAAAAADQAIRDALDVLSRQTLDPRTVEVMDAATDVISDELYDILIARAERRELIESTFQADVRWFDTEDVDVGLNVGVKHLTRWNPSYSLGLENETGGPLHEFDNKIETSSLGLDVWVTPTGVSSEDFSDLPAPPDFFDPGVERFGATFGAGRSEDTDRKPDGNGPSQIFSIDGLNTQNLTVTRNAQLETTFSFFDLAPYMIFKLPGGSRTNFLKALVALYYAKQVYDYNFSQEVSAGGAFFEHDVDSHLENEVYGAKAGLDWSFELAPGWRAEVGGQVLTGYQNARLEALQEGTNFGANSVAVTATASGSASQVGGGLGLERVFGNGVSVRVRGNGSFMGGIPMLSHPTASGQALAIDRGTGSEMIIFLEANIPLN